jgi:hypothetical protein
MPDVKSWTETSNERHRMPATILKIRQRLEIGHFRAKCIVDMGLSADVSKRKREASQRSITISAFRKPIPPRIRERRSLGGD